MKKVWYFCFILMVVLSSGCKKETVNEPILTEPSLTEQDRMEIWQLPDPTDILIGGLKSGGDAQWSPYPFDKFVVYLNDNFYRRYLAVYENTTYAVYDKIIKNGNQWVVIEYQSLLFSGYDLPDFNYAQLYTNMAGRNLPTKITIPPQYIEGKTVGNLTYEVNDPGNYGFSLLFAGTMLSAEVDYLVAVAKWQPGDIQINLIFSIPPPPNAALMLPYNFQTAGKYEVCWRDITGYHYTEIVVDAFQAPIIQLNAYQASDIQEVMVAPSFLFEGRTWVYDWSNSGMEYIIEEIGENLYGMEYYYK